ncbi:MAG: TonB C-terminal domain-containing protein [Bdellovibrio sp.]|nr:TonB C-terminal domain-containing protein [Bdellovibrio sp.]
MNHYSLQRHLTISTGMHLIPLALLIIYLIFFNQKLSERRKINIKLMENSVRVDVVAMPEKTLRELKNINLSDVNDIKGELAESPKPVEAPIKEDDIVMKTETPKKDFKSFLKELGQKVPKLGKTKDLGKGTTKGTKINNDVRSDLRDLVLAGNKLSEGRALVGGGVQGSSIEFEKYLGTIPDHVRPFWLLPSYLKQDPLQCRIRIYLGRDGVIIKAVVFESSGNEEYDERAITAIQKASPFPVPPIEFLPKVLNGQIILGFPL